MHLVGFIIRNYTAPNDKKTDKYQAVPQRGPPPFPSRTFKAVVPNLRSRGSGIGSQEGFVENSIIMKLQVLIWKQMLYLTSTCMSF